MQSAQRYTRRISTEEAREGYILVLKNKLSFFPHRGKPFLLKGAREQRIATVESYRCQCQGPDFPHEHYFIRWPALWRGALVTVTRLETPEPTYSIELST